MCMAFRSLSMADVYGIEMIICGRCIWDLDHYLWQMGMVLRLSVADVYGIEIIILWQMCMVLRSLSMADVYGLEIISYGRCIWY